MQDASSFDLRSTPGPFTKDRRDVPVPPAHQVLLHALRGRRDRQDLRGVLQTRQGPRGLHARADHRPRTLGHPVRNQEAALAGGCGARGGDDGVVVAREGAVGRGGDVLVASKAVEGGGGDDGVVVVEAEAEALRARDEACGGGVLDRRPL